MRVSLVLLILGAIALSGATHTVPGAAPVLAFQAGSPATATPPTERELGTTEVDLVKWGFTQGGLTLLLLVVLFSYRRDFFRRNQALRDEKAMLAGVIDKNAEAMLRQALAVNTNTEATKLLAQNVNNLAERRHSPR